MKALWLCLCLGLAACADTGGSTAWHRVDGSPGAPGQLESDKVTCEQEMKKPQATNAAKLDRDIVQADVYEKCMTRLGYTDSKIPHTAAQPSAAPVAAAAPIGAAPAGAAPTGRAPAAAPPPGAVAGAAPSAPPAPAAPSPDCRKVTDLRMWLPLCP
jgi:hypothetical protein